MRGVKRGFKRGLKGVLHALNAVRHLVRPGLVAATGRQFSVPGVFQGVAHHTQLAFIMAFVQSYLASSHEPPFASCKASLDACNKTQESQQPVAQ